MKHHTRGVLTRVLPLLTVAALGVGVPTATLAVAAPAAVAAEGPGVAASAAGALDALRQLQAVRDDPARSDRFVENDPALAEQANRYTELRQRLAGLLSAQTGVDPAAFEAAWREAGETRQAVVFSALAQVGVRYRYAASSPGRGFDCSGLTKYAWAQAGVGLPHRARAQVAQSVRRTAATAQPGDLVFYPGHIMLYLGAGNAVVHAPNSGSRVRVQNWNRVTTIASPLAFG